MNKNQGDPLNHPELTPYQRVLVLEMQNKPDLLHILSVIFSDYAKVILTESKFINSMTKRRKAKGVEVAMLRLKMEAYIEEKLAMLSGIDIVGLKKQFEDIEKNKEISPTSTDEVKS